MRSRKCDTAKYRRRRAKEKQNAAERKAKVAHRNSVLHNALVEARLAQRRARLADPKRQAVQRLVDVLQLKIQSSPMYRALKIAEILGVDFDRAVEMAGNRKD